jgi:hypothetical protein
MGRLDNNDGLELLRRANVQLERFFGRFAGAVVMGTDEEVDSLLQVERTLRSGGALLNEGLQESQDHEVRQELIRYRDNLVHLRNELARMQESAVGCRARLYTRQKHLHAAQAWCAASRATS